MTARGVKAIIADEMTTSGGGIETTINALAEMLGEIGIKDVLSSTETSGPARIRASFY